MDTSLKLYYVDNNGTARTFPEGLEQAELFDFNVNKTRMGTAPTITATLEYPVCLDDEWERLCQFDDVFVVFNNERYYLKSTPTSSKSNDKLFYKHDLNFISERSVLETVYMIDDNENQTADILYSNNTQYTFFGTIQDFAERINQSMYFSNIGDSCMYDTTQTPPVINPLPRTPIGDGFYVIVDSSVTTTEEVLVTLSNNTVFDALRQILEKWGVPYYFVGKEIHIGDYEAVVDADYAVGGIIGAGVENGVLVPYEYGGKDSVLTVSRNNATKQIYNRVSGIGSADNIPYYYPNPTPNGTIHHDVIATEGSLFSDSDVSVVDYLKFSNLSSEDALVYTKLNSGFNTHIVPKSVQIDGMVISGFNGSDFTLNGFWIDFPYDDFGAGGGEYYGLSKQIKIVFAINSQFNLVGLNFPLEFPSGTNWRMLRPDGVEIRGNGTFARITTDQMKDDNGEYVFGDYELYMDKIFEPSNPYQGVEWFSLDGLLHDILVGNGTPENPYLWFGYTNQDTYGWKSNLSGNMVYLSNYGLSVDETNVSVGDMIKKVVDGWILPQPNLMPSCYRMSGGTRRFYPARNYPMADVSLNDYDIDPSLGDEVILDTLENDNYKDDNGNYYSFSNIYRKLKQKEYIKEFPDIRPSIKGMKNNDNRRIDMFAAIDFDLNDDNSGYYDENGNFKYNHPYFFVLLRPTDSFNLFEQVIDESQMTIAMTSGHCAPCEFRIMVDKDTKKNLVQRHPDMYLLRDEEGDVICGRKGVVSPQDYQQDTSDDYVWIALEKDVSTFGENNIMPFNDGAVQIRPNPCSDENSDDGDTFVILHINLPQEYIDAAEQRLTDAIIEWMHENNSEKFNISLKYSRVYLGKNQPLVNILNENMKVLAKYNGVTKQYFVSSYTYSMKDTSPTPEINIGGLVETTEELRSMSASGGSFIRKIGEHISENFGELMMGKNKPFYNVLYQNNANVINQIKGDFPSDYVKTAVEMFSGQLILGSGGRLVKTIPNGSNGQVLSIENNNVVWKDASAGSIGCVEKDLTGSFDLISDFTLVNDLSLSLDAGKYLIIAQLEFGKKNEASTSSKKTVYSKIVVNGTSVISQCGVEYVIFGQCILLGIVDLQNSGTVDVYSRAGNNNESMLALLSSGGKSTMIKAIKLS